MSVSLAERSVLAIMASLRTITKVNGYENDAGKTILRCRRSIGEHELPALVVWEDQETVINASGNSRSFDCSLFISIEGMALADQGDTGIIVGALKTDIKRAVLFASRSGLGDSVGKIGAVTYLGATASTREDGASSESTLVKFQIDYKEAYGDPYNNRY